MGVSAAATAAYISANAATITAVAGATAAVGGAALQQVEAGKAREQQQEQFDEGNRLRRAGEAQKKKVADLNLVRAKRQEVRQKQIQRAEITSSAEKSGAADSSSYSGALGSVQTQGSVNLSFLDQSFALDQQASSLFGQASQIERKPIFESTVGSSIASLGSTVFNAGAARIK